MLYIGNLMRNTIWTKEADEELKKCMLNGMTSLDTSDHISVFIKQFVSKVSVLRRANFLGYNKTIKWKLSPKHSTTRKDPLKLRDNPKLECKDISIYELTNSTCRFMTGEKTYCGNDTGGSNETYCETHKKFCFRRYKLNRDT